MLSVKCQNQEKKFKWCLRCLHEGTCKGHWYHGIKWLILHAVARKLITLFPNDTRNAKVIVLQAPDYASSKRHSNSRFGDYRYRSKDLNLCPPHFFLWIRPYYILFAYTHFIILNLCLTIWSPEPHNHSEEGRDSSSKRWKYKQLAR